MPAGTDVVGIRMWVDAARMRKMRLMVVAAGVITDCGLIEAVQGWRRQEIRSRCRIGKRWRLGCHGWCRSQWWRLGKSRRLGCCASRRVDNVTYNGRWSMMAVLQWWRPILWERVVWFAVVIVEGIWCNIKIKPLNHTETPDEIEEEMSLNCKIVPRDESNFHLTITIYCGFVDDKQEITLLYCLPWTNHLYDCLWFSTD